MADQSISVGKPSFLKKLHDNGDGTFSDCVYMADATVNATVNVGTTVGISAGSAQIGHLEANQTVDNAKVAGAAMAVNNGAASAGTQRVTIASDSTGQVALAAGTAAIGHLGAGAAVIGAVTTDLTTPGTTNKVSIGTDGTVAIGTALPAGTALVGKIGIDQATAHANEVVVKTNVFPTPGTRVSKRVALTAGVTGGTVWTPTGGKLVSLRKLMLSCVVGGTVSFYFTTNSGNTVVGPTFSLAANGGWSESWREEALYAATADAVLKYDSSASFVGSAYVEGTES